MAKVLLILLVLGAIVWWLRRPSTPPREPGSQPGDARRDGPETMVRCAVCGLHLPQRDAIELLTDGRPAHVCGEAHRLELERRGSGR